MPLAGARSRAPLSQWGSPPPRDPPGAVLSGAGSGCCHQHHGALPLAPLCTPSNAPLFPDRFLPLAGRSDAESRAAGPLTLVRCSAGAWRRSSARRAALALSERERSIAHAARRFSAARCALRRVALARCAGSLCCARLERGGLQGRLVAHCGLRSAFMGKRRPPREGRAPCALKGSAGAQRAAGAARGTGP